MSMKTVYRDATVTVRVATPEGLDATKRRLYAAWKAAVAARELARALEAALTAHSVAHGKLRGAELPEYARLTAP